MQQQLKFLFLSSTLQTGDNPLISHYEPLPDMVSSPYRLRKSIQDVGECIDEGALLVETTPSRSPLLVHQQSHGEGIKYC